ncbi:MAG: hypothetical protein JNJ59_26640 [Deltaproteobacteria bacterium]|nr:hypothetical protein [Deltaproteobacteria bacterium]
MEPLRPALVIAAHGSKSPAWAEVIRDLVRDVGATPGVREVFSTVTAGFLEESTPPLADAVEASLRSGAAEVVVVPLFLTASTHQSEDVPGILGLPGPLPHVRRRLVGEGLRVLPPGLPIRLQSLGDVPDILYRNVLRRLALESRDRSHEAVVLVGYGSSIHHDLWEAMMHEVRLRLLHGAPGAEGFGGVAHAYCGHVVQLSPEPTYKAILHAGQQAGVKRVHVVPLLMAPSELQTGPIAVACQAAFPRLAKMHVQLRYAADAILPDGDLAARIAFRALEAVGVVGPVLSGMGGPTGKATA